MHVLWDLHKVLISWDEVFASNAKKAHVYHEFTHESKILCE